MKKYIAPIILAALIVAGVAFYGGMTYAKSTPATPGDFSARMGGGFPGGGPGGMPGGMGGRPSGSGFVSGEVLSIDDQSVTVKLPDGGSKIIFYSDSTEVTKSVVGAVTDVVEGVQVTTIGSENTDGSITAKSIQIRPTIAVEADIGQ